MTAETHCRARGHAFYPPADVLAGIPPLYGTEGVALADKVIHLHYFVGGCDWWVVEYDPTEGLAFGYACLGDPTCAEWGYVSLPELEALYQPGDLASGSVRPHLIVERDLYWTNREAVFVNLPGRGVR